MSHNVKKIHFNRRSAGVTDYKKRFKLVKSGLSRIVFRKSNRKLLAQIASYEEQGDKILASANSDELVAMGWPSRSNKPTAYLLGLLLANKYKGKAGDAEMVLDIGISSPVKGSQPFVFAKGCVDGGLKLRGKFEMPEETYNFSQTAKYAETLKSGKADSIQFSAYAKEGKPADKLPALFNDIKNKIINK